MTSGAWAQTQAGAPEPEAAPQSPAQAPAAQPPATGEPGTPPQGPVLVPPSLTHFVEATYPPEAQAQGLSARVLIELVVAPDGSVQDPKVVQPAGHGFDEAALEAVKGFRFTPATRDGEPVPARIRYPYVFEMRAEPEPEPEQDAPPPPASLQARVLRAEDDVPLSGASFQLDAADGSVSKQAQTGASGVVVFEELAAGEYTVRLQAEDRLEVVQLETLVSGEATEVTYRMAEKPDPDAFGATARVPPPPREVTRRSIGKAQLTRIPGTRGDALRTVELLPGVARPPLGAGALIVRGSSPEDSLVQFEGLPVPLLYHFGGLTSFINSRALESVEFFPGNFSVRYGRRRGGIVDVKARDLTEEDITGVADINLIDASILAEAPLSDDWSVLLAGRRSYIDLVFEEALPEDDISAIAAPVYYDYQLFTTYKPSDKDRLRLMVYGSSDEFALLFAEPSDTDAAVAGDFDLNTSFHRAHASWYRKMSDSVDHDLELAVGRVNVVFGLGQAFKFELSGTEMYGRSEWRARVNDRVRLIGGLDLFFFPGKFIYRGPPVQQTEGNPDNGPGSTTFSNRDQIEAGNEFTVVHPALYLESDLNLEPLRIVMGTRVDYYDELQAYSFDPRLSMHLQANDTLSFKAGVGMFSQPPQFQESDPELGNGDLKPTRTLHTSGGFDVALEESFFLGIDGFYKHLYDRVIGTPLGRPPFFVNDGEGRVYGVEVSARIEPTGRFFGYLSYTLSRSERKDLTGQWRLFDFDQPHILTISGVYRLGSGWEAGGTFRLVSGNPQTPVIGASFNSAAAQASPIYGAVNSARAPTFHRLDLRIEKLWDFESWKFAIYLDVQNVYNATNAEGTVYDYEFRETSQVRGLPILPNLGLRGEM